MWGGPNPAFVPEPRLPMREPSIRACMRRDDIRAIALECKNHQAGRGWAGQRRQRFSREETDVADVARHRAHARCRGLLRWHLWIQARIVTHRRAGTDRLRQQTGWPGRHLRHQRRRDGAEAAHQQRGQRHRPHLVARRHEDRLNSDRDRAGNFEIYVKNADGTGVRRLANDPAADLGPRLVARRFEDGLRPGSWRHQLRDPCDERRRYGDDTAHPRTGRRRSSRLVARRNEDRLRQRAGRHRGYLSDERRRYRGEAAHP